MFSPEADPNVDFMPLSTFNAKKNLLAYKMTDSDGAHVLTIEDDSGYFPSVVLLLDADATEALKELLKLVQEIKAAFQGDKGYLNIGPKLVQGLLNKDRDGKNLGEVVDENTFTIQVAAPMGSDTGTYGSMQDFFLNRHATRTYTLELLKAES